MSLIAALQSTEFRVAESLVNGLSPFCGCGGIKLIEKSSGRTISYAKLLDIFSRTEFIPSTNLVAELKALNTRCFQKIQDLNCIAYLIFRIINAIAKLFGKGFNAQANEATIRSIESRIPLPIQQVVAEPHPQVVAEPTEVAIRALTPASLTDAVIVKEICMPETIKQFNFSRLPRALQVEILKLLKSREILGFYQLYEWMKDSRLFKDSRLLKQVKIAELEAKAFDLWMESVCNVSILNERGKRPTDHLEILEDIQVTKRLVSNYSLEMIKGLDKRLEGLSVDSSDSDYNLNLIVKLIGVVFFNHNKKSIEVIKQISIIVQKMKFNETADFFSGTPEYRKMRILDECGIQMSIFDPQNGFKFLDKLNEIIPMMRNWNFPGMVRASFLHHPAEIFNLIKNHIKSHINDQSGHGLRMSGLAAAISLCSELGANSIPFIEETLILIKDDSDEDTSRIYVDIALAYSCLGNRVEAVKNLKKPTKICWASLAILLRKQRFEKNELNLFLEELQKIIEKLNYSRADRFELSLACAKCYQAIDLEKCRAILDAISIDKSSKSELEKLIEVYIKIDFDKARQLFNQAEGFDLDIKVRILTKFAVYAQQHLAQDIATDLIDQAIKVIQQKSTIKDDIMSYLPILVYGIASINREVASGLLNRFFKDVDVKDLFRRAGKEASAFKLNSLAVSFAIVDPTSAIGWVTESFQPGMPARKRAEVLLDIADVISEKPLFVHDLE